MRFVGTALVRRLAIPAAGALLALGLGTIPAAADTPLTTCTTTATNPATGQTLQICVSFDGATVDGSPLTEVTTCDAMSGPVSVTTQVGCYAQNLATGAQYPASTVTAPGDLASTGTVFSTPLDPMEVCVFGTAADVNGNTVSVPLTCLT